MGLSFPFVLLCGLCADDARPWIGTYTYPISFALPADVPASLHCTYGDVIWRLRATVHRPGAFTQRMTAIREVTIVAAPGEDDTEDAEAVLVERQWEDQLQYLITVSGKSFYIGGNIPVHITMMPLAKIKVYRISVFLEGEHRFPISGWAILT